MRADTMPDRARREFAEETDASADLGPAVDAAERMDAIHAKHRAALESLRRSEMRHGEDPSRRGDERVEV